LASKTDRNNFRIEENDISPVVVRDNQLIITNWETDDADVVSFFENKRAEDRSRALDRALKVGVVAANLVGTAERIDYVQKEFAMLETKFNLSLDTTLRELEAKFDDAFGERGKFATVVQDTFGEKGKIVTEIFNPAREGTPLYQLRIELTRQLTDLRSFFATEKTREAVEETTPRRGLRFEEAIEKILDDIVRERKGDTLENVTNVPGKLGRSKKGDFILRVAEKPDSPIVIETKAVETTSLPAIRKTLKEAMENRSAVYSILVASDVTALPESVGWFNEYDNDQLVCAVGDSQSQSLQGEILNIAVAWARIRVLQRAERASVNSVQIQDAVKKAREAIGRLKDILTQCKTLETTVDKIRDVCGEISREVVDQLNNVSNAVKVTPTSE